MSAVKCLLTLALFLPVSALAELPSAQSLLEGALEKGVEASADDGKAFNLWSKKVLQLDENADAETWLELALKMKDDKVLQGIQTNWQEGLKLAKVLQEHFPKPGQWDQLAILLEGQAEDSGVSSQSIGLIIKALRNERSQFLAEVKDVKVEPGSYGGLSSIKSSAMKTFALPEERSAYHLDALKAELAAIKSGRNLRVEIGELSPAASEAEIEKLVSKALKPLTKEFNFSSNNEPSVRIDAKGLTRETVERQLVGAADKFFALPRGFELGVEHTSLIQAVLKNRRKLAYETDELTTRTTRDLSQKLLKFTLLTGDTEGAAALLSYFNTPRKVDRAENVAKLPDLPTVRGKNRAATEKAFATVSELLKRKGGSILIELYADLGLSLGKEEEVLSVLEESLDLSEVSVEEDLKRAVINAQFFKRFDQLEKWEEFSSSANEFIEEKLETEGMSYGLEEELFIEVLTDQIKTYEALGEVEKAKTARQKLGSYAEEIASLDLSENPNWGRQLKRILQEVLERVPTSSLKVIVPKLAELIKSEDSKSSYVDYQSSDLVEPLAQVYRDANRPKDLLWIYQNYPWMDASFASELDGDELLNFIWALAETGDTENAVNLLVHGLKAGELINKDEAYERLRSLAPDQALTIFRDLEKRDQFQERPLIWQAQLAVDGGNFEKAEELAKRAIALDPSDGEQGVDDRMRVYAVLAAALKGQGKTEESKFFQNVVAAIRMGEDADKLYAVGLTSRALKQYRDSLNLFADAYCIQSRLAIYHAKLGQLDLAKVHYRRAFELMPSSFGRIESHCFGCEGAFNTETAQSIAEEVFTEILADDPENPQVHYLMGYLKDAQDMDSLPHYRRAVELDPLYFNAWSKLARLESPETEEEIDLRERANLKLVELDPFGYHSSPDWGVIFDIGEAWQLKLTQGENKTSAEEIYPFPGQQAYQKAQEEKRSTGNSYYYSYDYERESQFPNLLFDRRTLVGQAVNLLFE